MNKNYMQQVAEMLKVGYEKEEFKVEGYGDDLFIITCNGLQSPGGQIDYPRTLTLLLRGDLKIIKLPFIPKKGDGYSRVDHMGRVCSFAWSGDVFDLTNFYVGNCFQSKEEAEKADSALQQELKDFYNDAIRKCERF